MVLILFDACSSYGRTTTIAPLRRIASVALKKVRVGVLTLYLLSTASKISLFRSRSKAFAGCAFGC